MFSRIPLENPGSWTPLPQLQGGALGPRFMGSSKRTKHNLANRNQRITQTMKWLSKSLYNKSQWVFVNSFFAAVFFAPFIYNWVAPLQPRDPGCHVQLHWWNWALGPWAAAVLEDPTAAWLRLVVYGGFLGFPKSFLGSPAVTMVVAILSHGWRLDDLIWGTPTTWESFKW